ncbi:unnamed protein product [Echinostoma caproni]|uniref:nicotinamidase n=1 Tax=Echinostoma caproni TaxID=27848 RepID=A0A183A5B9_9TREM|nr:unnamed protein product [Echinostoma caproni]
MSSKPLSEYNGPDPYELFNSVVLTASDDILKRSYTLLSTPSSPLDVITEFTTNSLSQLEQTVEFAQLKQNAFKSPQDAALIVIDMQWDFICGTLRTIESPAKQDGANIISNVNKMLKMSFKQIYISQDWHPANHCSFYNNRTTLQLSPNSLITKAEQAQMYDTLLIIGANKVEREQKLWPTHCIANTEGARIHPKIELPKEYISIKKGTLPLVESYSAFGDPFGIEDTGLHAQLQKSGIVTLVLCGIATDFCVGENNAFSITLW